MPSFAAFGNQLYTGERSIDFIGRRRTWYLIAAVMVLGSLVALGVRGLNPSIEFRGGSEFRVAQVKDTSEITAQRAVSSVAPGVQSRVSSLKGGLSGNSVR